MAMLKQYNNAYEFGVVLSKSQQGMLEKARKKMESEYRIGITDYELIVELLKQYDGAD